MVKQNTTIIYENTVAGTFVRRMNRFTAEVLIDGSTADCSCEKYRAFAGASDAGSKGNTAEDIEPKSKNGI